MEFIQKFTDPRTKRCPECGGMLKRLISAPGIHFKGSGWYVTDYARKGTNGGESAGSNGSSASSPNESKEEAPKPPAAPAPAATVRRGARRTTRSSSRRRR
jgi:putative FmdB family regulatory protein